jgi:hypothetical protein
MVSTRLDKNQSIETKTGETLKEIGRRAAHFSLKSILNNSITI